MQKLGAANLATLLRREIRTGSLALNDRLPSERRMAETHGVARNTVREALNLLASENYVEIRRGSGTYVRFDPDGESLDAIDSANPLELIDARFALEPHICRLSVLHGKRRHFETLEALCIRMEDALADPQAFAEADAIYHEELARSTGNGLLIWIIRQINAVRSRDDWTRMRHLTLDENIITQYNAQHRHILNAIRAREPERAASLMRDHLETARLSLTRAAAT